MPRWKSPPSPAICRCGTTPGYRIFSETTPVDLIGKKGAVVMPAGRNRGGSTDMGDLSRLIPSIHPYTGGATGPGHSKSYVITDYETAVINPAKIMAMMAIDLLADGAKQAKEVKSAHRAAMSRSAYLRFQRDRAKTLRFDGAL